MAPASLQVPLAVPCSAVPSGKLQFFPFQEGESFQDQRVGCIFSTTSTSRAFERREKEEGQGRAGQGRIE